MRNQSGARAYSSAVVHPATTNRRIGILRVVCFCCYRLSTARRYLPRICQSDRAGHGDTPLPAKKQVVFRLFKRRSSLCIRLAGLGLVGLASGCGHRLGHGGGGSYALRPGPSPQ